ncbi:DUF4124 domain-containing protein [Pseudomonas sp. gcc21]|uniref:DUF4124 domain-containing protein n=1 Tax=Pseudomonas sp. gcc21 TaxID=2726989 RepID=UPI0014513090|nr:DUF4124 domain-containing protein [Pseudomonas sp. gcc21]QJD60060.1 DUF4124 domain-containing protein [Pseudomonas sp. gcc21]
MVRISILASMVLLVLYAGSLSAQVFSWTDENGNRVFSDQPHPDADSIDLGPVNTIEPPPASTMEWQENDRDPSRSSGQQSQIAYQRLAITSPGNDQAVRANDGTLSLTVETDPPLSGNHLLRAEVDGSLASEPVPGNGNATHQLQLNELDRGSHAITAVVVNVRGEVIQRSKPLQIHIQRTSLNQPGRASANQAPRAPAAPRAPNVPAPSRSGN